MSNGCPGLDGPIARAAVFLDINFNFQADEGELQATTDNNGEYSLDSLDTSSLDRNGDGQIQSREAQVVIIGGTDTTTDLKVEIPLISLLSSTSAATSTTPLTTLKAVLNGRGISATEAETLLRKIADISRASLSEPLESFDPYAAIGREDRRGIDIALGHIKVGSLLRNGTRFLEAAGYQGSIFEKLNEVVFALGDTLQRVDSFDLSNDRDLQLLFDRLNEKLALGIAAETVAAVGKSVAQGNQLVDESAQQARAFDVLISEVLPSIGPIKRRIFETLPDLTERLVKGEISAAGSETELQELGEEAFLVEYALEEDRTVSVAASPASSNLAEGGNRSIGQFVVTLGEAAPPQGLKIFYSLSGTATLGEDYVNPSGGLFGEIGIAPGATQGVVDLVVMDDALSEGTESIAISLRYAGYGYALDPLTQSAFITITDNDGGSRASSEAGRSQSRQSGGLGNDTLVGGAGDDNLFGNYGNDVLEGGGGNDRLRGGAGNDTVKGGEGNDEIEGNFGDDSLQGDAGGDLISGGAGNDVLQGNAGSDELQGGAGDDSLEGNAGSDELRGGAENDVLQGNENDDWLVGEEGEDILIGGAGADLLNGGDGADVFYFNAPGKATI